MYIKALRNILVGGQHFDEGAVFDTDIDTANRLLSTRKVEKTEAPKKPEPKKAAA